MDLLPREIEVIAYSGYKLNERPLYFILDSLKLEVRKVMDRWYGVDNDYFKVMAGDGKIYLIRWNRYNGRWFLEKIIPGQDT